VSIDTGNSTVAMAPLSELDQTLGDRLPVAVAADPSGAALVPVVSLAAGAWSPAIVRPSTARPFALLVVEGLLIHDLVIADSTASELLGPGDMASARTAQDVFVPTVSSWTVVHRSRVALLDPRITGTLQGNPVLATRLLARAADQCARLASHRAIVQLPRVEDRLLALFGHLAERWGRVGSSGLIVPLRLTHEMIGRLVGARRPTVSLGLKALSEHGIMERRDNGSWLIAAGALDALASGTTASPIAVRDELVERPGPLTRTRRAGRRRPSAPKSAASCGLGRSG
jgi:CRP/FNR family cyclic AMP-dependent transcriptional regulator